MDEDELLAEFGFATRARRVDRTGVMNGLYVCVRAHETRSKRGQLRWVVRCTKCGMERIVLGSDVATKRLRCYGCEGSPNISSTKRDDWDVILESVKQQMVEAIATGGVEEIESTGRRIAVVASKVLATRSRKSEVDQ